ncbi:Kynurenine--oxoglutarate transaminase 3-like protein [Leptotrombidium deliense]|uniref:kynurenine--oxoglutarate transaminase n=1 Tax=Leptotrombidium deliense TaxID=299467 RepID=A0A443S5B4_9ACAR|nr:Kynurenine--oxoglutarate transaminase 3-like protein [Leptotrombidium deliense]
MIKLAQGIPVYVPLRLKNGSRSSRNFKLDEKEFESKFSSKTKMIIVNTPHNPTGKVFTYDELNMIAKYSKRFNTLVLMDETYEWTLFDENKHIRMNTLPEMWNRTITIGSAGKTFSATGWKIGYAYGPENLIAPMNLMHLNIATSCATPLQEALAVVYETETARLDQKSSYFTHVSEMLQKKRDKFVKLFKKVKVVAIVPEGGYFLMAEYSKVAKVVNFSSETGNTKDVKFSKWLAKNKKLAPTPGSALYSSDHEKLAKNWIRFSFVRSEETLNKVEEIINKFSESLAQ